MSQPIDIKLTQNPDTKIWDISLDANGDLEKDFGFGTTLGLSIFEKRRADDGEVPAPQNKEGWIGNILSEVPGYERGSKLWLLQQSRLSDDIAPRAKNAIEDALDWLIEDGLAKEIEVTVQTPSNSALNTEVNVDGDSFYFDTWNNTRFE